MSKREVLRSTINEPEVEGEILEAFDAQGLLEQHPEARLVYEHGHWWVTCPCGASYDVVDVQGVGGDTFGFEEMDAGDETFHEEEAQDDDGPRKPLRQCIHCDAWIDPSLGADSPADHADAAGTEDDPRSPSDWDDVCDQCGYGKGLPSRDRETTRL